MNPIKQVMIDAVMGKAFLGIEDACRMANLGFAKVSGSELRGGAWKWNKEALGKLSTEELVDLYSRER